MLSEGGIGWIPYLLERMDYTWERHRLYQNINQHRPALGPVPEALLGLLHRRRARVDARDTIGVANILVEVDYPHSDSNWPNSRKRIAENLVSVSDDDVHRIVELNARALLHFGEGR